MNGKRSMKIVPASIGFDIDGVVADTMEAFLRMALQDHGITTIKPADITCEMVEECLDIDPAIVNAIFERLLNEPLAVEMRPMTGAVEVLREMAQLAPLTFITARPQARPIAAWLERILGPQVFGAAELIAMGEHDGKVDYIKSRNLHYFVDDRLQTCLQLDQHGITPIVYNQPWNEMDHGFITVDGWEGIRELCLAEGGQNRADRREPRAGRVDDEVPPLRRLGQGASQSGAHRRHHHRGGRRNRVG